MNLILVLLAAPLLLATTYLLLLTVLSGRRSAPICAQRDQKFLIIVPAHDEAAGIARTVESLKSLDWPADQFRTLVIADNCSDDTASIAREAGAQVLERSDANLRGKGYALKLAYEHALEESWADAVVVIDADTDTSPLMLRAFAARLEQGAGAVQAFYGVRNPMASWRTRLSTIALAIFHRLRGRGRERLGLSSGLRGNGMCFALEALRKVPHRAFSLVEDLEYGIELGRAGIRVWYADEAEVLADMVSGEKAARSQRERWEGGRLRMAQTHGPRLLADALRQRSAVLLDLAADVLTPPLGYIGLGSLLLVLLAFGLLMLQLVSVVVALIAVVPLLIVLLHVARGVSLSGLGLRAWLDIAMAPFYVLWKLSLMLRRKAGKKDDWIRTQREP